MFQKSAQLLGPIGGAEKIIDRGAEAVISSRTLWERGQSKMIWRMVRSS